MFLSREIDIKLCHIYTKIHMQFYIKVVGINRSYSTNTKPIWKRRYPTKTRESQVCYYYNFLFFILHFAGIIDNIITYSPYSPYSPYYVTRTSANGNGNRINLTQIYVNISFKTWESLVLSYTPFHFSFTVPLIK